MSLQNLAKHQRSFLVTGGAGFIGSHLIEFLLKRGDFVVNLDNFNSFYDPQVKRSNIAQHLNYDHYVLIEGDLRSSESLEKAFNYGPFDAVIHLAAMAGVRPSIEQPHYYMDVNINGTQNLLDYILSSGSKRLIFGSSSSVYGNRSGEEFLETDRVNEPLSPYAASKAAGELICHAAHHIHGLPIVCLRFFTVFGARQRPDLAIHKFCKMIEQGQEIELYGDGQSKRDYTFVSDIVNGIAASIDYDLPGFDIINLGRSDPIKLVDMITCIEQGLRKSAKLKYMPMPPTEMPYTFANIEKAKHVLGYSPQVSFDSGIEKFVDWYLNQDRNKKDHGNQAPDKCILV